MKIEELEEIADRLNEMQSCDQIDLKLLEVYNSKLSSLSGVKFKLVDFVSFSETGLKRVTIVKENAIRVNNFELAADRRQLGKEFQKHVQFRKYFKIERSFFYPEEGKLFYFYLGTERNDEDLKVFFFENTN